MNKIKNKINKCVYIVLHVCMCKSVLYLHFDSIQMLTIVYKHAHTHIYM